MPVSSALAPLASLYRLGLPRTPIVGRSGEQLGRGIGNSLEFQEYRSYLPGDDLRHVDWFAYARSDSLMLRMYREEISPRTEILLDASRSMNSGADERHSRSAKAECATQLVQLLAWLSARGGGRPVIFPVSDDRLAPTLGPDEIERLNDLPWSGQASLPEMLQQQAVPLRAQAVRIVVSDFLFPHDPGPVVRRLAAGAGALWLLQVISGWEAEPTELGGRRLIDLENEQYADLRINRARIQEYQARLKQLQRDWTTAAHSVHAQFLTLVSDRGLPELCREVLRPQGLLQDV